MALRLIEVILPHNMKTTLEEALSDEKLPILNIWIQPLFGIWEKPVRGIWEKSFSENLLMIKILLPAEDAEGVLDFLAERFSDEDHFRIVLLPVVASLPRYNSEVEAIPIVSDTEAYEDQIEKPSKSKHKRISREELYEEVNKTTDISWIFLFMVILSSIVAAVGVMQDNVAVIIGAMVIAPLLGPNVALSLASLLGDWDLGRRALEAIILGIVTAIVVSFFLGFVLPVNPDSSEIASRTSVGLGDVALALAAGCAGALAFTTGVSATLIGVMVAVALLPPLVTSGLLMGSGHESLATGAVLLFTANLICVNLAGVITFFAQGIGPAGWLNAKKAKKSTWAAILIWLLMLTVLVTIIISQEGWG